MPFENLPHTNEIDIHIVKLLKAKRTKFEQEAPSHCDMFRQWGAKKD